MIFSFSDDHVDPLERPMFLLALFELVLFGGTGSDLWRMWERDAVVWSLVFEEDSQVPSGTGFRTGFVGNEWPLVMPVEDDRTGMAFGEERASVTISGAGA
jgi:hypothetical protein